MRPSRRAVVAGVCATTAATAGWLTLAHGSPAVVAAATPIQHLVVIFDENVSFDHYFGTYPNATNPAGEPAFAAKPGTPAVDGLSQALLMNNPNAANPQRIDRANALTCDQNHGYAAEQLAFDNGLMDKFVENTAGGSCTGTRGRNIVMDYFDGNTVTALWNLAQNFAMSDNFYGSTFGPSTPGALNLIAGTTHGVTPPADGENGSVITDPNPALDDCQTGDARMNGTNIGDLMNAAGVTWGWFQGGFRPSSVNGGTATCATAHKNIGGASQTDYSAHHEPFMYYASTTNQHHVPPSSVAMIGHDDGQVHHQYDLTDFDAAVRANDLPQVSFLKAAAFEDGHPGNSDPLDEQHFIARTLDELEQSPDWGSTAVVIAYDDSDGWYDHKQVVSQHSDGPSDQTICNTPPPPPVDYKDRCGPGPRLPLLVISPWVKVNSVDHTQLEQASITRFVEDNWLGGRRIGDQSFDARAASLDSLFDFNVGDPRAPKVYLDPSTGEVVASPPGGVGASPATTPTPTPTAGATMTPTATPTAVVTPIPTVTPPPPARFRPKISVRFKLSGRTLRLTVRVSGVSAKRGRITVSVKLRLRGKTLARSAAHRVSSGRVKIVLRAKHRLRKGRYTLAVRVRQGTASRTSTLRLTLR
jgi:phospholipase C